MEDEICFVCIKAMIEPDGGNSVEMMEAVTQLAEDTDMELEHVETDYMMWLVDELKELNIDDDVVQYMRMLTLEDANTGGCQ